jgi:hypothetical protein
MMSDQRKLCDGYCFDYGSGWAEMTTCELTSFLGVELHQQGGRGLNARECRRLASFLSDAADWLDSQFRPKDRLPSCTVVYAISDGHMHHKIGKAVNVTNRLKQLQTGNGRELRLVAYIPCSNERIAYQCESWAKKVLEPMKSTGEWFECDASDAVQALYEAASACGLSYSPVEMENQEATDGAESR